MDRKVFYSHERTYVLCLVRKKGDAKSVLPSIVTLMEREKLCLRYIRRHNISNKHDVVKKHIHIIGMDHEQFIIH
jgi:hypothetical protein